ncbi:uncharacterized protein K02A2.6-like [Setaria italica]|uniref:uncharacterized protein K02A2.6-like n=1 Tax=Setaria italica TaxID=4555 RepID=UPI0007199F81|nr:uncharacterized protein K02A2.6-like [Setaria italica]
MTAYCHAVYQLEDKFDGLELNHVARRFNEAADELAKAASGRRLVPTGVFISNLHKPSVRYEESGEVSNEPLVPDPEADPSDPKVMEINLDLAEGANPLPDWRVPYLDYLIFADATRVVRTYEGCQFYARQTHVPAQALQTIPITWPFTVWGLDLVEPFKKAPGGFTHLLVTVDKFSKWIKARPIAQIKSEQAVQFFTDITHHFGIPNSIITDNTTQFIEKKFLRFYDDHHIRVDWSAMAHPRTNGQVKRANGMILQGLKPWIFNRLNKFSS